MSVGHKQENRSENVEMNLDTAGLAARATRSRTEAEVCATRI
jgi:hypothetical protein